MHAAHTVVGAPQRDPLKNKSAATQARTVASAGQVKGTRPSHPVDDYLGEYEHPAYGVLTIARGDTGMTFDMHDIRMPLTHFHYDRFDTPDDEEDGKWSVNFRSPSGGKVEVVYQPGVGLVLPGASPTELRQWRPGSSASRSFPMPSCRSPRRTAR